MGSHTSDNSNHSKSMGLSEIKDLTKSLKTVGEKWKKVPIATRVELLRESLTYFERNKEEIAEDITVGMGKPLIQSENEIKGMLERANYLLEHAEGFLKPEVVENSSDFIKEIQHKPLGVLFIISAWNYPLLITINGLLSGLLAGNTVLLKHADITEKIGDHFEKAFGNIPGYLGVVRHAMMDHPTAAQVLKNSLVDHVVFTGSTEGGKQVYQLCTEGLIGCSLELGGKDAAYVAEDSDILEAAETIVDGCMYNTGQSCCGIERVFVHKEVYQPFIDNCKTLLEKYVLGDPQNPESNMGPLARASSLEKIAAQINHAQFLDATVESFGKNLHQLQGNYLHPTLITQATPEMDVMKEENFGPILPVCKVENDEEAIEFINRCEYGLTSSIFTRDIEKARHFSDNVETGTVFMNRCDYLDPALPWTGYKKSGLGSSLSKYGFMELTKRKSIHFKLPQKI